MHTLLPGRTTRTILTLFALAAAPAVARAGDPTPDEVIANSIKALGGQEAIDKINTLRSVMSMNMSAGGKSVDVQLESCWARSGGRMSKTIAPMGEVLMASDGKIAWMKQGEEYRLLTDAQADELNKQAGLFMNILDPTKRMKETAASIESLGKQTFAEKDCWHLHVKRKDGTENDVYFVIASGLPAGSESTTKVAGSEVHTRSVVSDWLEQDGVKFFRTVVIENPGQPGVPRTLKVTAVEVNKLDDAAFAPPPEVLKLAQAKAAAPATTAPAGGGGAGGGAKEIALTDLDPKQQASTKQALNALKSSGDVKQMSLKLKQLESMVDMVPPEAQLSMKYIVQELKKEVARLGG